MSQENVPNLPQKPSKEEIITALLDCTKKLGRVPAQEEFCRTWNIGIRTLKNRFPSYAGLLSDAGLEKKGAGRAVPLADLFKDWARIVRELGKAPTVFQFETHTKYSITPLRRRFGSWKNIALAMVQYAQKNGLEDEWKDVVEIVRKEHGDTLSTSWMFSTSSRTSTMPGLRTDRPTFGESLSPVPMTYAPTNEHGVLFLFGKLAEELGFAVMRLQSEFPDCKAMRRVDEKRWQEVWIELEFESRNFLTHMHDVAGCDLIVCWEHNWPECPLEVVELKKVVKARR